MKNKLLNVGIYLRLSDEDKNKASVLDNSESIKNQRLMLRDVIGKNDNFILVDEYCDEDLSGAGTYRPEFERLIRDCENGRIDVVLCKSQSRFSRDMEIIEKYLHNKFIEWNVRFISLADNADTDIPSNKKMRQINGLVNEWYLEEVSNNIRSSFNAKMKNGELIAPFAPYGYLIDINNSNKLIVDNEVQDIVRKIYNLYLSGYGYKDIALWLNEKNVPSPSYYKFLKGIRLNVVSNKERNKIKWCGKTIKDILTNEVYIGNLVQGKRTTVSYKNHKIIKREEKSWIRKENKHEAIIDKKLFYDVQRIIKNNYHKKSPKKGHILAGKVYCLECSNIMRYKTNRYHNYLVCSKCYELENKCENKGNIRYDKLESIIFAKLNKLIQTYIDEDCLKDYIFKKNDNSNYINKLIKERGTVYNDLVMHNVYLSNLYKDKINAVINMEQFMLLSNDFNDKRNNILKKLKDIECKINDYNLSKFKMDVDNVIVNNNGTFKKLTRIIVEKFIKEIYIGKRNEDNGIRKINIIWDL